jgi:FkbM family methyltransferase
MGWSRPRHALREAANVVRRARDAWPAIVEFRNFPTYFQLLRDRGDGQRVLVTRKGVRIAVRENVWDARIVREMFLDRPYVKGLDLPPSPTVIDIGGYIGDFSLYASQYLGARVFVYEPTAENFELLQRNVDLNDAADRISAFNQAVGEDGRLTLNVQVDAQEVHSSAYWYPEADHRSVESVSLASAMAANGLEHVDLVKIDCEGGEYDIVAGASDGTLARIGNLVAETHDVGPETAIKRRWLHGRLHEAGFAVSEVTMTSRTGILRATRPH